MAPTRKSRSGKRFSTVNDVSPEKHGRNLGKSKKRMSHRGSSSGGHRRSSHLAEGKVVAYVRDSSPDTDDEYDVMENPCTRADPVVIENLRQFFDAKSDDIVEEVLPTSSPGITIGGNARPSGIPHCSSGASVDVPPARTSSKRPKATRTPPFANPMDLEFVMPGIRYPPQGGIRPRNVVSVPLVDTPLLTNLVNHPSTSVRRCEEPHSKSTGRGGWSDFHKLLANAHPEYRAFLVELGFGPFLSIPYMSLSHPLVRCWVERFFHHTGTFHLSNCEMGVLPLDWSTILGIRFEGRVPPSERISGREALAILGLNDPAALQGTTSIVLRVKYLKKLLEEEKNKPPNELRYRQWAAYFIFSCFLGDDKTTVPIPIVGMFRDVDTLREYDWGALTYGFYIRGLRRFSRRETSSFLGFWQFTVFWAFEHFPTFRPTRLRSAPVTIFPLARRWDSTQIERLTTRTLLEHRTEVDCIRNKDILFQPYTLTLIRRPELVRAFQLSRQRVWIRTTKSWELFVGERTVRQLSLEAVVPVDPPSLMTIEDYVPATPRDAYLEGVDHFPDLIRIGVPYQEWFAQNSLGSLMALHEVEGGRVLGGVAQDSFQLQFSGEMQRLQAEVRRLQLELLVSDGRFTAAHAQWQEERATYMMNVQRLEDQLLSTGVSPVTRAETSDQGHTSTSSSTSLADIPQDWFFAPRPPAP